MNRKERRKNNITQKPKTYHLSQEALDKKMLEATTVAFEYMMCIPIMVIHDKFSQIMRKESDGVCREERFFDLCLDLYESFSKQYVTFNDMAKAIREESGFDIESRFRTKKGWKRL